MDFLLILLIFTLFGYFIAIFYENRIKLNLINSQDTIYVFKPQKELWNKVFKDVQKIRYIHFAYFLIGLFFTIHSLILGEEPRYILNFSLLIFLGSYIIIGLINIALHTSKDYDLELKVSFFLIGVLLGFIINLSFILSYSLFTFFLYFLLMFPIGLFLWLNYIPTRWKEPPYYIFTKEGIKILGINSMISGFWYYIDLMCVYKLSENWLIAVVEKDLKGLEIITHEKNILNIQKIFVDNNISIEEINIKEFKNKVYYFNY